jgi:hypothetical protein
MPITSIPTDVWAKKGKVQLGDGAALEHMQLLVKVILHNILHDITGGIARTWPDTPCLSSLIPITNKQH